MTARSAWKRVWGWLDAAFPAALFVLALVEVVAGQVPGPLWATIPWAAVTTLPLYWRRWHPWLPVIVLLAAMLAAALAGVDQTSAPSTVLALLTALYSLANRLPWPHAVAAFVIACSVLFTIVLTPPIALSVTWVMLVVGAPMAAGAVLRNRRMLIERLRTTAEELDRSRSLVAKAAVAEERTRVARELHDVVAHSVSVMVVQAGAGEKLVGVDDVRAADTLHAIGDSGRQALRELRRLLSVLRGDESGELAPQPGLDHLETLVSGIARTGLDVRVVTRGDRAPLTPAVDLIAYRIVQEALTNVVKHADARTVTVELHYADAELELCIDDDGRGGEAPALPAGTGSGIAGMTERAHSCGGELTAGPRPDGGFRVTASLPRETGA